MLLIPTVHRSQRFLRRVPRRVARSMESPLTRLGSQDQLGSDRPDSPTYSDKDAEEEEEGAEAEARRNKRNARMTRTTTLDNAEMEAMMLQEELEEMEAERAAKERHLQMSQKAVPWVETQFFAMLMAAVVLANSVVIGFGCSGSRWNQCRVTAAAMERYSTIQWVFNGPPYIT
ncbi:unnamed protein product [Durusdinium trenchii]|uniref:Uncharacterized protein n=1 Tax=Durusdinium trenchii TaxID=1381693 RepID=A0ABP0HWN6_9DINO